MNRRNFFAKLIAAVGGVSILSSFKTEETVDGLNPKRGIVNRYSNTNYYKPYRSRPERYVQYEQMETDPRYAKLLDDLAHDVMLKLNYESSNDKIKQQLDLLFGNVVFGGIVNFKANGFYWIRNTAKYGNNFVQVITKDGLGVRTTKQLVNANMRIKDITTHKRIFVEYHGYGDIVLEPTEYEHNEIIYFSVFFDRSMLPYGTSMLERVRTKLDGELYFDEKDVFKFKQSFISSLDKLVIIHLNSVGFKDKELLNYKITFS